MTICLPVRLLPSWVHMSALMAWLRTLLRRTSRPAASHPRAGAQRHRHATTLLKRGKKKPGAVNRSGLRDLCDGRRYVALVQRRSARRARQDRRWLISGRRGVNAKRQLERRAYLLAVKRVVVGRVGRWNPVRRRCTARHRWAEPQGQRTVGVLGQLVGGELCRSELRDRLDHSIVERAGAGDQVDDRAGSAAGALDRDRGTRV